MEGKDEVEVYDKDGEFFFCQRMRFRPIADVWSLLKSGRKGNRIILYIPGSYQGRIVIRDGNSSVNVRGLSRISELEVTTSNSSISCLDTQVNGRTKLWTGNSSVTVSQWEGDQQRQNTAGSCPDARQGDRKNLKQRRGSRQSGCLRNLFKDEQRKNHRQRGRGLVPI